MTFSKYEIFNTVVELGNLTRTAEKLNLTQSGVSYAISSLESELGISLLKRNRSGISLTSNGERILVHIQRILKDNELLQQELTAIKRINTGTIRIGTLSSVSTQWLPGILSCFHTTYPLIEIKTYLGCYDEISTWISNGTIDFGFTSLPTAKPFDTMPLKKDKLVVLLPPNHPLQDQKIITFDQLSNEHFIMPQWGIDDNIKRTLIENKVKLKINYELMEERTILAMVQMGLGISILPELILVNIPNDIHLVDLEQPTYRILGIAALSLKDKSPATKKFITCMRSWLHDHDFLDFK
ncbi:DNA-binding transcriptional LysR family regulator [Sporomusaceae bacterium BoRhaA]|uniref:LysR family transcriptional regulator n=1 Tax=Pelorhabdus rhamnosifermentans TaxID=2772457 RepID=UPI001C0616D9|nr:LysR family transcriptional regulator [Pelorhabdus rhamnosifermentans]MBU2703529.1 DNA-binding transcriptional LysR family regulator [Pelorhabdus rhamnosifermentans]